MLLIHSVGGTVSLFDIHPETVIHNVVIYAATLQSFWLAGHYRMLSWFIYGIAAITAGWTLATRARSRSGLRITEIFLILYVAVLLVYKPTETRFLFPIFPLYLALSLATFDNVGHRISRLAPQAPARNLAGFGTSLPR
jgi:hypothetical protein